MRKPPKDKETGKRLYYGIYTKDSRPTCLGGQPMDYLDTNADGEHHFRWPAGGFHLKPEVGWPRFCDSEYWEN